MTKFLKAAALAAVLGACAVSPASPPGTLIVPPNYGIPEHGGTTGRECSNAGLDQFRGRVATSAVGAEMLRVSGARIIRWVQPGMMITMEFSPERLTVHLGRGNVIERATCG